MPSDLDDLIIWHDITDIVSKRKTELYGLITTEVKKAVGNTKSEIVQEFQAEYDYLLTRAMQKRNMKQN